MDADLNARTRTDEDDPSGQWSLSSCPETMRWPQAADGYRIQNSRAADVPVTMSEPFLLSSGYLKKTEKERISMFFLCDLCASVVFFKNKTLLASGVYHSVPSCRL